MEVITFTLLMILSKVHGSVHNNGYQVSQHYGKYRFGFSENMYVCPPGSYISIFYVKTMRGVCFKASGLYYLQESLILCILKVNVV